MCDDAHCRERRHGTVGEIELAVVVLEAGREALVSARVETDGSGPVAARLEVAIAPTPLTSDESIA